MKWRPSGRICGQRCEECLDVSSFVRGDGTPPEAETRDSAARYPVVNAIVSSAPHEPPRAVPTAQIAMGRPPDTVMRLSLKSAKNASERLSGDQKGYVAFSVPGRGCAVSESSRRNHNLRVPPSSSAE